MSSRSSPKHSVDDRAVKHSRRLSLRRLSAYVGSSLGVFIIIAAVLLWGCSGVILNSYGRKKAERAFAEAHPGSTLRIGKLDYSVGANRLVAQSVTLSATHLTLKAGRISLTDVRWARLLWGTAVLADVLVKASCEVTNLEVEFPQADYAIRCDRLRASLPDSSLIAEGTELQPLSDDEAFFAARAFRTPRFRIVLPECKVLGLAYGEVLQGTSYRARAVHFLRPSFEALINRDKPPKPFEKSPLMVHEALASLKPTLQIGSLSITNGQFRYCERLDVGADPAVLTFGAVSMSIAGIANRGDAISSVQLRGQGELMNAGTMMVRMTIPINSPDLTLRYSGSLSAMDLTRLDAFLDLAEHIRIKSGSAQEAAFEIDVTDGQARGYVRAIYRDLEITVLGQQTGSEKGFGNRVASFLANVLKIRNSNAPDASGSMQEGKREGKVDYRRSPKDTFLQFVWFALRTGVLDVISH